MNKKLPLYLQSCLHFFKVNFRPHSLALFSFLLFSLTAFAQGPGCPNGDDLEVTVGDDFQTCPKESHTLTATTNEEDVTFQWYLNGDLLTGETDNTLDIMVETGTMGTQTYSVIITADGCSGTDSVDVRLYDVTNCVITEGISPNGDGFNDSLDLSWLNDRTGIVKLKIYSRYGTLVFDQRDYSNQWAGQSNNGNDLPTGTYFYVIDLKAVDAVYGGRTTGWIYLNRKAN